ncbi:MAG: hypothetical protein WBX27_02525 [Specibacter sp.]
MPASLAALAGASGWFLPRTDALYAPAYLASRILALAAPLAFVLLTDGKLLKSKGRGNVKWLFAASCLFAVLSAAASWLLLSMGSPDGAAGDIGGLPMWILATTGLLGITLTAEAAVSNEVNVPERQ